MSRLLKLSGVAVLVTALLVLGAPAKKAQAQPGVSVSFQMFYNSLQPYGQWVDYPQYGYCWVPNVGRDFRPYYSNGHWVMTEYGNTWVSNYDWGWAPFHYGNWTYDEYYGWLWVPGTTWGPAWVSWRNGGGHYGWAPIAPGVSVNVAIGSYNCGPDWWVFVPQRHIYSRSFHNHWRGPRYNNTYINNTTIINNTYINNNQRYVYGPRSQEIQRATGQQVRTYGVRTSNGPGRSQVRGNSLNVYRPNVERRNNERPERYASVNERRGNSPRAMDNAARNDRPDRAAAVEHNSAPRNSEIRSREYNRPSARANAPQQQERITERRQEAWQQRSQPARQQPVDRSNEVQRQRPQYNNRSVERARPQPQQQAAPHRQQPVQRSAPQRSMQRSEPNRSQPVQRAAPQRNVQRAAPQRSQPAQRAAGSSGNMQRSAPANRGRSSNDKWR